MKKITSLLIALLVLLSLAAPALAAETSSVTYRGHKLTSLFNYQPGQAPYETDLFTEFKNVMPGDKLTQFIDIENEATCCDYIKLYIQAIPHDSENIMTDPVLDELTADDRRGNQSQLTYMLEFLNQMTLKVYQLDDKQKETEIFSGKAGELDGLQNKLHLATLAKGKSTTLKAVLTMDINVGNEFADRIGEVDWKLTIEEYDYASDSPKTGDHLGQYLLPAIAVMGLSAAALIVLLLVMAKRRKKK